MNSGGNRRTKEKECDERQESNTHACLVNVIRVLPRRYNNPSRWNPPAQHHRFGEKHAAINSTRSTGRGLSDTPPHPHTTSTRQQQIRSTATTRISVTLGGVDWTPPRVHGVETDTYTTLASGSSSTTSPPTHRFHRVPNIAARVCPRELFASIGPVFSGKLMTLGAWCAPSARRRDARSTLLRERETTCRLCVMPGMAFGTRLFMINEAKRLYCSIAICSSNFIEGLFPQFVDRKCWKNLTGVKTQERQDIQRLK